MVDKKVYKDWYIDNIQQENLVWNILRCGRCHEITMMGKERFKRGLSWGKYGVIKNALETYFGAENPEWRIFRSLEYLRQVDENGKKIELLKGWEDAIFGFDFALDVDSKEENIKKRIEMAHNVTAKIIDFLDKYNVQMTCKFSGNRGFHINIMWRYRRNNQNILELGKYFEPNEFIPVNKNLYRFITDSCLNKKEKELIDDTIYTGKRVWTLDYSLHTSGLVALPLERKQFETFDLSLVDPYYIIKNIDLRQRHPFFNPDGNFEKLYKDFIQSKGKELDEKRDINRKKIEKNRIIKENLIYMYHQLSNKDKEEVKLRLK